MVQSFVYNTAEREWVPAPTVLSYFTNWIKSLTGHGNLSFNEYDPNVMKFIIPVPEYSTKDFRDYPWLGSVIDYLARQGINTYVCTIAHFMVKKVEGLHDKVEMWLPHSGDIFESLELSTQNNEVASYKVMANTPTLGIEQGNLVLRVNYPPFNPHGRTTWHDIAKGLEETINPGYAIVSS